MFPSKVTFSQQDERTMSTRDSARLQRLLKYLNDGWDAFIEDNFPGLYPEDELFNLVTLYF
jgi:hypothetical protein